MSDEMQDAKFRQKVIYVINMKPFIVCTIFHTRLLSLRWWKNSALYCYFRQNKIAFVIADPIFKKAIFFLLLLKLFAVCYFTFQNFIRITDGVRKCFQIDGELNSE